MNMEQAAELATLRADVKTLRTAIARTFELDANDLAGIRQLKCVLEALVEEGVTPDKVAPALGVLNALLLTAR